MLRCCAFSEKVNGLAAFVQIGEGFFVHLLRSSWHVHWASAELARFWLFTSQHGFIQNGKGKSAYMNRNEI